VVDFRYKFRSVIPRAPDEPVFELADRDGPCEYSEAVLTNFVVKRAVHGFHDTVLRHKAVGR